MDDSTGLRSERTLTTPLSRCQSNGEQNVVLLLTTRHSRIAKRAPTLVGAHFVFESFVFEDQAGSLLSPAWNPPPESVAQLPKRVPSIRITMFCFAMT